MLFSALLNMVALLVVVFLLYRSTRSIFRRSLENRKEKIIAAGITAVFFKSTIYGVTIYPLSRLVYNLQSELTYLFNRVQDPPPASEYSVTQVISAFPIANLFIACACYLIIYNLICYISSSSIISPGSKPQEVNSNLVYNVIVLGVLGFSLFLVISVFITIPYLKEIQKPSIFTQATLDSALSNRSVRDSFTVSIDTNNAYSNFNETFANDTAYTRSRDSLLSPENRQNLRQSLELYQQKTDRARKARIELVNNLREFGKRYKKREEAVKKQLSLNFFTRSQNIVTDKARLFQSSLQSFDFFQQLENDNFYNILQSVKITDQFNQSEITRINNEIRAKVLDTSNHKPGATITFFTPDYMPYPDVTAEKQFQLDLSTEQKRDGSEWGIFGVIAKYLIETQSSELVLLIGMLGFGLLGASIFSFKKSGNFIESFKTKPLVKDFANVLTRGFGAALVVYLATKGGLTIFTGNANTDTNGYILLLTCFTAAIFSDRVWDKIEAYLYGPKGTKPGKKDDEANEAGKDKDNEKNKVEDKEDKKQDKKNDD